MHRQVTGESHSAGSTRRSSTSGGTVHLRWTCAVKCFKHKRVWISSRLAARTNQESRYGSLRVKLAGSRSVVRM